MWTSQGLNLGPPDYEAEIQGNVTVLKRRLSEADTSIKQVRIRFAEGRIDDETFQTAIEEFQNRKDQITLELGHWNDNLSNLEKQIPTIVTTATHIGDLWHNAGLETKRRIQNLVFPDGILWDKEKRDYRTLSRNKFFDVLDKFTITYGDKKETAPNETVPLCGWGDSNPHAFRHQILSLGCLPIPTHPPRCIPKRDPAPSGRQR